MAMSEGVLALLLSLRSFVPAIERGGSGELVAIAALFVAISSARGGSARANAIGASLAPVRVVLLRRASRTPRSSAFCGRAVAAANPATVGDDRDCKAATAMQRYAIDERIKRATTRVDPKRRPSLWAKVGGAFEALSPRELRPGRSGERESIYREYPSVAKYQADVDRLIKAGWEIDQQVDRQEKIVVRWAESA